MRRILLILLTVLLLSASMAMAAGVPVWGLIPQTVRPGQTQTFSYSLPQGTTASIEVWDNDGNVLAVLAESCDGSPLRWDGEGLAPGEYTLVLNAGLLSAYASVTVGEPVPAVRWVRADEAASPEWTGEVNCTMDGELTGVLQDGTGVIRQTVTAGENTVSFSAAGMSAGDVILTLTLTANGESSAPIMTPVTVRQPRLATDTEYHTAEEITGVDCPHEVCYWSMKLGDLDDEAVWQVLTQPITVLDAGERHQVKIRKEPREDCTEYTGEVTGRSQGVHVLERGEEWTLIQAYSSSVEGSRVAVYAKPFTGYVKTELLIDKPVSQEIGIVIDKLQQRLYVYRNGKLFSTLLCSTGFPKKDTPFNETPAGEFLCQSWTGGFWSGSLWCDYGIRINDGILLHEVPVVVSTNDAGEEVRDTERCERYLGEKASHGCIRIQRKLTPEGVNMKWLWDNLSRPGVAPTKVIIWDEIGRTLGYPEDGVTLYYNTKKGKYYHSDPKCQGVKSQYWPLTAFTYGELEDKKFKKLTPCPYCAPQLRHDGIDTVNKKNTRTW